VVGGVGAVALITGGVLAFVSKAKYDGAHARCRDGSRDCPPDAVADSESAFGLATGATVMLVAGAATLAVGAILLLAAPSKKNGVAVAPHEVGIRW
jgi:hypothetical protein